MKLPSPHLHTRSTQQYAVLVIITALVTPLGFAQPVSAHIGATHNFAQEVELNNRDYLTSAAEAVTKQRSTLRPRTQGDRKHSCNTVVERLKAVSSSISSQTADEVSRLDKILDASLAYMSENKITSAEKAATNIQDTQHRIQLLAIGLSAMQRKLDCNYADPAQLVAAFRLNLADSKKALETYRSELLVFMNKLQEGTS